MDADKISEFIFPVLILLFYLFTAGRGKKKKKAPASERHKEIKPLPLQRERRLPKEPPSIKKTLYQPPREPGYSPPPVQRTLSPFESTIEKRGPQQTSVEKRTITPNISEERAQALVSTELSEHIDMDEAYAIKSSSGISKGKKLFQKKGRFKGGFSFKRNN